MENNLPQSPRRRRSKALQDLFIVLILGGLAFYLSILLGADEFLADWFMAHQNWRSDQFLTLLVIFSFGIGMYALRRWQELRQEVAERNRVERLSEALADIGRKLGGVTSPREAAMIILEKADELFKWDACFLSLYSEKEDRVYSVVDIDTVNGERREFPSFNEDLAKKPRKMFRRIFSEGSQLILRKRPAEDQIEDLAIWGDTSRRSASLMFVPIRRKGEKIVGVLSIQSYTPDAYTQKDLEWLTVLADYCSAAIERTRTQQKLRQSRAHLELMTQQMPAILWTTDQNLCFTLCLGAGLKSIDLQPEEMVGKTLYDFFQTHDGSFTPVAMHVRALEGESNAYDLEWQDRFLECYVKPLRDAEGQLVGCINVAHDITERRSLQKQLHHSQNMEALGQLAGGVAHDFNNILQAILGYTQCAQTGLDSSEKRFKDLEQIRKATDSARNLTRQLLAFGRRQLLRSVDLDLNEVILDLLKMLRRVIGENIELDINPGANLGTVNADAGQMEQVLMNLFVNARDAMPQGGKITLKTESAVFTPSYCRTHPWAREGRYVLLQVTDTGEGMPPDVQSRIFEPFFTTKEEGRGTGLGLAMVYGIIRQHNGFIHVYSEPSQGTVFKVYLPIVENEATEIEHELLEEAPGGTETILVAEDEEMVREVAVRILEDAGYTVLAATNGEEAIEVFNANKDRINLALFDVIMPKLSGRAVYDYVKAICPELPVLFSSGYSVNSIDTGFVIEQGMELIEKPYDPNALMLKIRQMLDTCKQRVA